MYCTLLLYGRLLLPYIGPYPHRYIYVKKHSHYSCIYVNFYFITELITCVGYFITFKYSFTIVTLPHLVNFHSSTTQQSTNKPVTKKAPCMNRPNRRDNNVNTRTKRQLHSESTWQFSLGQLSHCL